MPEFPEFPEVEEPSIRSNWWDKPVYSVERALEILQQRAIYLTALTEEGIKLRELLEWVEEQYDKQQKRVENAFPNAFFVPSFEQSLLLNCWWCGIDFPICFAANRIGKTFVLIFNAILWIYPNNPDWHCFRAYNDATLRQIPEEEGRLVHVLQRPPIDCILKIQSYLKEHPELMGDPLQAYYDKPSGNYEKFATLQKLLPDLYAPAWPAPPITKGGTIWLGAPDNKYHREIILPLWKKLLPSSSITQWSDADLCFTISTQESGNPKPTVFSVTCKSYESQDTKWSGDAVRGIILTEGIEPATLDEIKQRIQENGFISWDYTPYEAANVGKKSALAKRVYEKKEELPLQPFVFTRFSARTAPTHILPASKRKDLIRMWDGKPQGKARLDGDFFTTSPQILSKLDRKFHCLTISKEELFYKYPNGQLYRSIDPGFDHPTACAWFMLTPQNVLFCYRFLCQSGLSLPERCKLIIEMSGNVQGKRYIGKRQEDFILYEAHTSDDSEVYNASIMDYKNFKVDDQTGRPLQLKYINEGLVCIPSATWGDADRAQEVDKFLDKVPYYTHPIFGQTPSSRLFFLINEPGVSDALDQMESLFWERYKAGDRKGMPKDEVPQEGDDELDVLGQMCISPFKWSPYRPQKQALIDNSLAEERFATLQMYEASTINFDPKAKQQMVGRF